MCPLAGAEAATYDGGGAEAGDSFDPGDAGARWRSLVDLLCAGQAAGEFRDFDAGSWPRPLAALSFKSCLRLVNLLYDLGQSGAQVICATHSPVLAATPGADIIEVGDDGFQRIEWEDLDLVDHWRRYMNNPTAYLRYITDE